MHNKIYEQIKKIISNNYKIIITWILIIFLLTFNLPFYINKPGGVINISDKFEISGNYSTDDKFHMAYVTELQATIPIWLFANIMPSWEIIKKEKVILNNETREDVNFRNKIMLEDANNNAIIVAYNYANKNITLTNEQFFISFINDTANTDLQIGDEIILINDKPIEGLDDITFLTSSLNVGDKINVKVVNNNQEYDRFAYIQDIDGKKMIGILITPKKEIITNPPIKFNFNQNESGPSGGLMMSLAIYNTLTNQDITKGNKIAGTGTINKDGVVGEVSGIKHKILGAVKEGIEIFLIPAGKNTTEAMELKEAENLDIQIIPIETFKEALDYLETL